VSENRLRLLVKGIKRRLLKLLPELLTLIPVGSHLRSVVDIL